jgi:hypothetical protein
MKKIFFVLLLVVSAIGATNAQVKGQALGIRFGGFDGYGAEVSYQHPLSSSNRLEFDLGANRYGFGLNGVYQWVWDLSALSDGFNWYAGVGAGLGSYDYKSEGNAFGIGVLGQIGIEYNFNIPIQLSLDYRPGVYVVPSMHNTYDGICFSARYKF